MNFPTLYKKTNTGAIQSWMISVENTDITVTFGHFGGKQQTFTETIDSGKNIGQANETTPEQQATNEGQAKWEKQLKKGYVRSIEDAESGAVDSKFVEGGVLPMLAPSKVFGTDANLMKKLSFPISVQPKLDGSRCIAVIDEEGEVSLWSRTRKAIRCVPHLNDALREMWSKSGRGPMVLDGELYNHDYKNRFGELMSIIRKDAPDGEGLYKEIQYHIYDLVEDTPFSERSSKVRELSKHFGGPLRIVSTFLAKDEQEGFDLSEKFIAQGYEGAMFRNNKSPYESGKRSHHLQKVKKFDESEFEIVGTKAGRGKYSKCTVFVLQAEKGTFDCLAPGTIEEKQSYLSKDMKGKLVTVKYQGFTDTDEPKPRFPIAKAVRDYE